MDLLSSDRALQDALNEFGSMLSGWHNQRAALRAVREKLVELLSQVEDALRYTEDRLRDAARGPIINEPDAMAEEPPSEEMSPAEASTEVPPTSDVENMAE